MKLRDIAKRAPDSGRRSTLTEALEHLHQARAVGAHIVEVGTTRNLHRFACNSDGWATRVFAWYASQTKGRLTSIDTNPVALVKAKEVCKPWLSSVTFIHQPAEVAVRSIGEIDLLYMDGPPDPLAHIEIYRALIALPRFVLWDDIITHDEPIGRWPNWPPEGDLIPWSVKGALAIPAMIEDDGYRVVFARERQVLLTRKEGA